MSFLMRQWNLRREVTRNKTLINIGLNLYTIIRVLRVPISFLPVFCLAALIQQEPYCYTTPFVPLAPPTNIPSSQTHSAQSQTLNKTLRMPFVPSNGTLTTRACLWRVLLTGLLKYGIRMRCALWKVSSSPSQCTHTLWLQHSLTVSSQVPGGIYQVLFKLCTK